MLTEIFIAIAILVVIVVVGFMIWTREKDTPIQDADEFIEGTNPKRPKPKCSNCGASLAYNYSKTGHGGSYYREIRWRKGKKIMDRSHNQRTPSYEGLFVNPICPVCGHINEGLSWEIIEKD